MIFMETAKVAESISGKKLYQIRARKAFPILVRQAIASMPITYSNLADELDMPNPRNLNYVLGSIGQTLKNLSEYWNSDIPQIQSIVVNRTSGLPGEGISWFITDDDNYKDLSLKQRRQLVEYILQKVYSYYRWHEVLSFLGLEPAIPDIPIRAEEVAKISRGGESQAHKSLKLYISQNPGLFSLPYASTYSEIEHPLPSGDILDVFFDYRDEHVGVEVKSEISDVSDIVRGLYQCVKYQAILEARQAVRGITQNVRTFLVLADDFPNGLIPLRNVLGVNVIDNAKH